MSNDKTGPTQETPPPQATPGLPEGWPIPLCASFVLTALCCFPILLDPAGHLAEPPYGDKGANLWNLWWVYYALSERGTSPLDCDIVFFPWGVDLRHHTLSLMNGLLAAPLTALFGPSVSYNALFLLWTALTLHFAAMWARGYGLGLGASLFVGFAAAMGPYRWAHLHHLNLFSTAWLFLAFYACDRMTREASARMAALFAIAWAFTALTDWYYALFVGFYFALRLFFGLLETRPWREIGALLGNAFIATMAIALILAIYFHRPEFPGRPEIVADPTPPSVASFWSLDAWHLALPPWALSRLDLPLNLDGEFHLHPGLIMAVLGLLGLFFANGVRGRFFLLILATLFFVLAMGPFLRVGGEPLRIEGWRVPLPAAMYALTPPLVSMRVFTRFAFVGFMAITLLAAGMAGRWTASLSKTLRPAIWAALGVLLLFESDWRLPQMAHYQAPDEIARVGEGGVAEFPFTPTSNSGLHLYHQTIHRQPIYVAEFSRLGAYRRDYLSAFPVLNRVDRATRGESAADSIDIIHLCSEVGELKIHTIITHSGYISPDWLETWEEECLGQSGINFWTTRD